MRRHPSKFLSFCIGLSIAVGVIAAPATRPATAPTTAPVVSKELRTAMDQLAADEAADRLSAQDQIVQIGLGAIEPLKQLIKSTRDVEQRNGAQAALARIAEQASTGPTYITMKMDNASASDIIKEFSKQAGGQIKNYTYQNRGMGGAIANAMKYSVNIEHQPFWEAARTICKTTGLNIVTNRGRGEAMGIGQNGNEGAGPYVVDGPFMIVAQSISMNSNVQLSQPGNINRNQSIQFYCYTEPKMQITQHPYMVKLTEVVDDTGKSLLIAPNPNMYESMSFDNQLMWNASSQLVVHDPAAKKIVKLKGSMRLQTAVKTQVIEIADIMNAKNVTESAGGYTITVKDASTSNDQINLNVTFLVPPNNGNLGYQLAQKVKLLDAKGEALQNNGANGGGSNTKLEYKLTFSKSVYEDGEKKVGDPVKLQLPIVLETRPVEFNFEFKDLPLP